MPRRRAAPRDSRPAPAPAPPRPHAPRRRAPVHAALRLWRCYRSSATRLLAYSRFLGPLYVRLPERGDVFREALSAKSRSQRAAMRLDRALKREENLSEIPSNEKCGIREVWRQNLHEEFKTIRRIVPKYRYVAMDTEFPGIVARPIGEFRSSADYHYQLLRCNVDLLRIIQLGLTFMDENGKTPGGPYVAWQFNFQFNLSQDMYAQDSIDLLKNSGIQFKRLQEDGIDPVHFAELLMSSGIVLMDNIQWLTFHSGYDFGYLLKLLTDQNLPTEEAGFFELMRIYFPNVYDVKYLMKSCKSLGGGLQEVSAQLDLERIGPQHQAGSDSLLTGMAFFKMRDLFFEGKIDTNKFRGHLYGLGPGEYMPHRDPRMGAFLEM